MKIKILAVGGKMPGWVQSGYHEYAKRLPAELTPQLTEIPLGQRRKGEAPTRAMAREGRELCKNLKTDDHVIALAVDGKPWSTEQLADRLSNWQAGGRDVCLLIGGPDGLDSQCLERADQRWSLSALTLPHPLVRVLLAEQLYRAWSINAGHPYHR
ncbi:MAG TPA: 23S rRNA (pseudouridine(1915)-N(3))-methyltransferase RlmH [Porticoccaceae bacterium]|nr:23S rRNA (pseudouridine(1915)-N(3))-methyltransferase RlmH [Porticoccaceae bacterium]HCO61762.1 23S rRNA (pseudouridine(1915)-N(3))-methyltransferase RlmH [Porticoccaceae bacterium]